MKKAEFSIRKGTKADLPRTLELIKELALYEKAPNEVTISLADLEEDGFGENPVYTFWVGEVDGAVQGIAICYIRYSTWKGRMFYLEDLIVSEAFRGVGMGKALFNTVAKHARDHGYRGMVWQVLDWNESALEFYRTYVANLDGEWVNGILSKDQLHALSL
jgi:ribosomal protein S18 acetylase RimI-like enzyme